MLKKIFRNLRLLKTQLYLFYCSKRGLKIGQNCRVMKGVSFGSEPYLIHIDDEVTISFGVSFITHDGATWVFRDINNIEKTGKIFIKKRAFIGANSTILPNVSVGRRAIVAAGSLVCKSIPDGEVWGGVPAKKIMSLNEYYQKVSGEDVEKIYFDQ